MSTGHAFDVKINVRHLLLLDVILREYSRKTRIPHSRIVRKICSVDR
ncbi:MAG: ribbon-helix-helix domain-containing protein [Actinomyces sp.]|nr:ribbon-helix-helix domain-containing protein [Actinomyces sp.]